MLTLAIAGLAAGGAYAIFGVSIVVLKRMAGVVNFSQAVVGAFGAYTTAWLTDEGWNLLAAALVGIVVAVVIALAVGLMFARFFSEADEAVRTAAMIALTVGLFALGFRFFGDTPRSVPVILPGRSVSIGGVVVTASTFLILGAAAVTVVATIWLLERTRIGSQVRALSERPIVAELLGVPVYSRTIMVWGASGLVTAVGMILVSSNLPGSFSSLGFLIFPAMAAALIGAFESPVLAFVGGVGVGVLEALSSYRPGLAEYRGAVPFLIALLVLLWTQRNEVWGAAR